MRGSVVGKVAGAAQCKAGEAVALRISGSQRYAKSGVKGGRCALAAEAENSSAPRITLTSHAAADSPCAWMHTTAMGFVSKVEGTARERENDG